MFDVLTVAAVGDELTGSILDRRIQRVGLTSRLGVAFEIYTGRQRRYLVASAEADDPRLMLVDHEPSFDSQLVTPLLLLLRKYTRGGIVVGIEQPPLERVVRVSIAKRLTPHNEPEPASGGTANVADLDDPEEDEDGIADATYVHFVVEIMGRHSNLVLVDDDGSIMDAAKRVTSAMSRVRPIAPRMRYTDPPIGDRLDPRQFTAAESAGLLATESSSARLAAILPRRLRGISPQMAREIAFRTAGDGDLTVAGILDSAVLARETRRLLEPLLTSAWAPRIYRDTEGEPIAFSAVPMAHLAATMTEEAIDSVSRAAELCSGLSSEGSPVRHAQKRARLAESIKDARARTESRVNALQVEMEKSSQIESLRQRGELIYAYLWAIQPGQSELDVDGELVPLDPALSAKENAQAYFERYRKAQSAGVHVPELMEQARTELAYIDQLLTLIEQADTFPELEDISVEWERYGKPAASQTGKRPRPRSTPPKRSKPLIDRNGNAIYIGRSGAENDRVTFDIAGSNDTWLHARGVPGSHVIVKWSDPAGAEDEDTLETAAALAAYYSASRTAGTVEVDITRRRHVRKIKGAGPGMVTYRQERTVPVRPLGEAELANRLRGR